MGFGFVDVVGGRLVADVGSFVVAFLVKGLFVADGAIVVVGLVYVAVMICTMLDVGFKVVLVVNRNLIGAAAVVV